MVKTKIGKAKRIDLIHRIAGIFVLVSALLGYFHNRAWLFLAMFVGLNLLQYSFTNFCPLEIILKKLGFNN